MSGGGRNWRLEMRDMVIAMGGPLHATWQQDYAWLTNNGGSGGGGGNTSMNNLHWALFGDSVTEGAWWRDPFFSKVPALSIDNYAVSGATWCDKTGTVLDGNPQFSNQTNNTLSNQVQRALNISTIDPDIIVLFAGVNDILYTWPGAVIPNESNVDQYYKTGEQTWIELDALVRTNLPEAIRWCVETLRGKFTKAEIILVAPYQLPR